MAKKTTPKDTKKAKKTKGTKAKAKSSGKETSLAVRRPNPAVYSGSNGSGMELYDTSEDKLQRVREALKGKVKTLDHERVLDQSQMTTRRAHVPSGSMILDFLIGGWPDHTGFASCPGFPRGMITQIGGDPGTGKTTIATTASAAVCSGGGTVTFVDWEHAFDPRYAMLLGVPCDSDLFMWSQPNSLEDGFRIAMRAAKENVDLIIFDSVGVAIPEKNLGQSDEDVGELGEVGLLQRKWSRFLPKFQAQINRSKSAVVAISQKRANIGGGGKSFHGPKHIWQGGTAWQFFAGVRIDLRRIGKFKKKVPDPASRKELEVEYAAQIQAEIEKSKVSSTSKKKQVFVLRHGEGIDSLLSAIQIGSNYGLIKKAGSWYNWERANGEVIRGQGIEAMRDSIKAVPDAWPELYQRVRPLLYATTEDLQPKALEEQEVE